MLRLRRTSSLAELLHMLSHIFCWDETAFVAGYLHVDRPLEWRIWTVFRILHWRHMLGSFRSRRLAILVETKFIGWDNSQLKLRIWSLCSIIWGFLYICVKTYLHMRSKGTCVDKSVDRSVRNYACVKWKETVSHARLSNLYSHMTKEVMGAVCPSCRPYAPSSQTQCSLACVSRMSLCILNQICWVQIS